MVYLSSTIIDRLGAASKCWRLGRAFASDEGVWWYCIEGWGVLGEDVIARLFEMDRCSGTPGATPGGVDDGKRRVTNAWTQQSSGRAREPAYIGFQFPGPYTKNT